MVAPTGKTPRYKLTEAERKLCADALRRERRMRRSADKGAQAPSHSAPPKKAAAKTLNAPKPRERCVVDDDDGAAEGKGVEAEASAEDIEVPVDDKPVPTQGAEETPSPTPVLRAEKKAAGKKKAPPGKKQAPAQVPAMWNSAPPPQEATPTVTASATNRQPQETIAEDVHAAVVGMLSTIESVATNEPASAFSSIRTVQAPASEKRRLVETSNTRKRRRRILQDESAEDEGDTLQSIDDGVENAATSAPPSCIINGDPNLMAGGAQACTGLNSDEDNDLREEVEEEDDEEEDGDCWVGDWDIGNLTDEDSEVEEDDLPASVWSSTAKNSEAIKAMKTTGWEYDPSKFGPDPKYADLYDGPYGPSKSVLAVAEDPLALLFYFMPPKLWQQIAIESNRYHSQSIPARARAVRSQQRRSGGAVEELGDIQRRLAEVADIEAWEVLRVMALLIARMLAPIRKGIAAHWSLKRVGALPVNRFGQFMTKNRFFHIMGYLHFSNNKSPQARLDRAWKIRPVVDVLQRTFARGYQAPPVISFDEATLPSRSRYNPTRQFNKDKPHKWGTKIFVAACAKTAYCMRIEVYCGAKTHLQTPVPKDNNTGEAAVLRNMNALCPPSTTSPWRLVITDRFYTSVKLALELLHRRMYLTGTISVDRSGFAKDVVTKMKTKTVNKKKVVIPAQGTTKLAENKRFPQLTAVMWMDRNPVHMLSSGGSRQPGTVMRRVNGEMKAVPAPELVRDYHRWMGGVDVHDQLRMQRYSVQLSYKTRKYYKTLFLGLFDMAVVNAFIVYRHYRKVNNQRPPRHFAFLVTLMEQLLAVDSSETFEVIEQAATAQDRTAASPARGEHDARRHSDNAADQVECDHRMEENPDTVQCEQGVKRRQRSCKVCAVYKVKPRKFTKYFCPECSNGNKRKYLCNVGREGRDTCFRIWHLEWNNGNNIPRTLLEGHKPRERPPATRPGKKRRRRAQGSDGGATHGGVGGNDGGSSGGDDDSGGDGGDSDGDGGNSGGDAADGGMGESGAGCEDGGADSRAGGSRTGGASEQVENDDVET